MNKKSTFLLLLLISVLFAPPLFAGEGLFSGMVRDYASLRLEAGDIAVHEQTVDVKYEYFGDIGRLYIHPTLYSNPDEPLLFDLKEAYFDFYFSNIDLRVGKQTIIWGEAEGAFITDIVSPRDMRSFILADFSEIRKAVPAIKMDLYLDSYTLETIWVTHFIPSSLPDQDSLWAQQPNLSLPPTVTDVDINNPTSVSAALENSELFLSLGHFSNALNWKLNGGYTWTDEPLVTGITIAPPTATIDQGYERYFFFGGSMNTSIGSTVVRFESALAIDKPMNAFNPPQVSIEKHHQVQSLIGFDWNLFGVQYSIQYLLTYTHDHHDNLRVQMKPIQEFAHTVTFRVQDTYFDDRLTAKIFAYVETVPLNALIRPSLSYSLSDGVLIEGGLELFVGDEDGMFGSYQKNTMAWAAIRWYF